MNTKYCMVVFGVVLGLSLVHQSDALECYVCNTGSMYEGEQCESNSLTDEHLIDCSKRGMEEKKNFTMCRKQYQNFEGETRLIRDCAEEGNDGCARRTGTHEITLIYCECFGDKCNSANKIYSSVAITISVFLSAVIGLVI